MTPPRHSAFTIIELMITISIIAILIAAAAIGITHARASGRDTQRISDILTLAQVIDQSAATHNDTYPVGLSDPTSDEVFADQMDPAPLDLSLFRNDAIPYDPSFPTYASRSTCNDAFSCGYVYDNRQGNKTDGLALNMPSTSAYAGQYEYVLQVGLETDRFSDDQSLVPGPQGTQYGRTQYLFLGKYCGASRASDTCSIP